jgi:diguanylate cyclase (GGDEF)-like protein
MALDLSTLFTVTVFTSATAGCLLLASWLQHRGVTALAYWGIGFLTGSLATALIVNERSFGEFWSVTVGHVLLAAAYGVVWMGVREFNHRPTWWWAAMAGAIAWIVLAQIDVLYQSPYVRTATMAAIVVSYSTLAAIDFWHARHEGLMSRWPVIVLLILHSVMFLTRIPLAGLVPMPDELTALEIDWLKFLVFETILHAFCVAYLFGGMARERVVLWYKQASLTDPLTGVANRRSFMQQGDKFLQRGRFDNTPTAVLALDLDHFKQINDRYGHAVGDNVLVEFCRIVAATLRPTDLFGRVGGEEFACLLPNTSLENALTVAERLRAACAEYDFHTSAVVTVSIGLAMADTDDLVATLANADRALYRAKADGRNRVACAEPWPQSIGSLSIDGAPGIVPAASALAKRARRISAGL